jgi:hypothetical protein
MNKKEKSKVILVIVTASLAVLSALNLIFENQKSNCLNEVRNLQSNMTWAYLNYISGSQEINYVFTTLLIENYTNISVEGGKIIMPVSPDIRNITKGLWEGTVGWQTEYLSLNNESLAKQAYCDGLSSNADFLLYVTLILSIISIFCAVYPLYK